MPNAGYDACRFTRMALQGGFAKLSGSVVEYDPRKSFVPNLRIGGCLAIVRSPNKSLMGVRGDMVDLTSPASYDARTRSWRGGDFLIPGVAPMTAYETPHWTVVGAYKLDDRTGDIVCAPDQGAYGQNYPTILKITSGFKDLPLLVFDCKATSLYDIIDPQLLSAMDSMSVYDGNTDGAPSQFGAAAQVIEKPENPRVEDAAVVFTPDTRRRRFAGWSERPAKTRQAEIAMRSGASADRLLLLNASAASPTGIGYDVTDGALSTRPHTKWPAICGPSTSHGSRSLAEKGVVNEGIELAARRDRKPPDCRQGALRSHKYSEFDSAAGPRGATRLGHIPTSPRPRRTWSTA